MKEGQARMTKKVESTFDLSGGEALFAASRASAASRATRLDRSGKGNRAMTDTVFLVCRRLADDPGVFSDNLRGVCSVCAEAVIFRPYMPRVTLLCLPCFMQKTRRETAAKPC
jgi:hypothetical protein